MEARSESKGYYEETLTDSTGSFRLRGLLPDTTYAIRVVSKDGMESGRIERASPESVTVTVKPLKLQLLSLLFTLNICMAGNMKP